MKFRKDRVSKLIKEYLSALIMRELEFDGAIVTITDVAIGDKLETAKVRVSVWPSAKGDEVLKKIEGAKRQLQFLLLRKINIKPMPTLFFELDFGSENAAAVEKALLEE